MEKEEIRKVYAGYDLGEEYCQISLFSPENGPEPISVPTLLGGEKIRIPMVLAKKKKIEQWYYGEEAIKQIEQEEALPVTNLFEGSKKQETIELEGKQYQMVLLLQMYVRKTFALVLSYVPLDRIEMCTFAVENIDKETIQMWKTITEGLPITKAALRLISYKEGFAYYTAFQEELPWEHGTILLEYSQEKVKAKMLTVDKGTVPKLLFVEEKESDIVGKEDALFFNYAKQLFLQHRAAVVYLIGEGLSEGWYPETLKLLCQGRRVFRGQNLYGLGALQFSGLQLGVKQQEYLYLGDDQLHVNFFLKAVYHGEEMDYELISAELHWYEAESSIEFVPDGEREVAVFARSLDGKCEEVIRVALKDFPDREEKASRLQLRLYFTEKHKGVIEVEDLGFGQFYEATHKVWKEEFDLQLLEQKLNGNIRHIKER